MQTIFREDSRNLIKSSSHVNRDLNGDKKAWGDSAHRIPKPSNQQTQLISVTDYNATQTQKDNNTTLSEEEAGRCNFQEMARKRRCQR